MDKKWLLGIGVLLFVIPFTLANDGILQKIRIGEVTITKTLAETVYKYPSIIGNVTFNTISASTRLDVSNYIEKSNQRLEKTSDNGTYIAVITFNRPISKIELDELINQYHLHPMSARFSSYPTGGGNMVFPITATDMEELENGQIELMQRFRENKAKDSELIYDEKFKLFDGFVSIYVKDSGQTLKEINNSNVLLVDVGPIEQQIASSLGIVFPGNDIYFEYKDTLN